MIVAVGPVPENVASITFFALNVSASLFKLFTLSIPMGKTNEFKSVSKRVVLLDLSFTLTLLDKSTSIEGVFAIPLVEFAKASASISLVEKLSVTVFEMSALVENDKLSVAPPNSSKISSSASKIPFVLSKTILPRPSSSPKEKDSA